MALVVSRIVCLVSILELLEGSALSSTLMYAATVPVRPSDWHATWNSIKIA